MPIIRRIRPRNTNARRPKVYNPDANYAGRGEISYNPKMIDGRVYREEGVYFQGCGGGRRVIRKNIGANV